MTGKFKCFEVYQKYAEFYLEYWRNNAEVTAKEKNFY